LPIGREADLVAGDHFPLADVDIGLAVEGGERCHFEEEVTFTMEKASWATPRVIHELCGMCSALATLIVGENKKKNIKCEGI